MCSLRNWGLSLLAVALWETNLDAVLEHTRKLISLHQFHIDPYHIMLSTLASGIHPAEAFGDSKLQKHLNREVRVANAVAAGEELQWQPTRGRFVLKSQSNLRANIHHAGGQVDSAEPVVLRIDSPSALTTFGQTFLVARSYQSAICAQQFWCTGYMLTSAYSLLDASL